MTEEIDVLKAKEQKLLKEIKKRGDLARQLCSAKDDEIRQLREKLHFDQRQHQSTLSSQNEKNNTTTELTNGDTQLQTESSHLNMKESSSIDQSNSKEIKVQSNNSLPNQSNDATTSTSLPPPPPPPPPLQLTSPENIEEEVQCY